MIRCYLLPVEYVDGVEQVAGIEFIHHALLECTIDPGFRILTQDTSQPEHDGLAAFADTWSEATQDEIDRFNALVVAVVADPDVVRARELLATSPAVITMPEIWELLRIIGRRSGWCD